MALHETAAILTILLAHPAGRGRRVVCPDLPGRGQSDRLSDSSDYVLPQYCSDMNALIAALGSVEIHWVGTSLGGLIGMVLAAIPGSPIRRLVINDIGPYLPWVGALHPLRFSTLLYYFARFSTLLNAVLTGRRLNKPSRPLVAASWRDSLPCTPSSLRKQARS
jgi:pimeloyl-ACP methyl ester carboxylesterase